MSKITSDQSTTAKAKITKLFPTKARKESQESIKDEEKLEQGVVNERSTETEKYTHRQLLHLYKQLAFKQKIQVPISSF